MGVLRWVDHTVSEPSYFKLNTDHTPLHLVLVDEVSTDYSYQASQLSEPRYFKLNTNHTPLHLVLVDEVSADYSYHSIRCHNCQNLGATN